MVAPYAVTFYATHKCNLACSYCTQKEPDVFSEELSTADTKRVLRRIRKESDSIVITGGEPTLRADIEELVEYARHDCKFRSLLLITNGTLLDRKPRILAAVTGLVVSLDALATDPTNPLSKPAALPKVLENLAVRQRTIGEPAAHHHQHGDRGMEYRASFEIAGLVRRAGICVRGAIRADGKDAQPGAAEKSRVPRAGGQNYRAAAREHAADQWNAADHRDAAALQGVSVFSDDVSARVSQWRRVLSVRAAAQGGREFIAGWIAAKDFRARERVARGHSAVPGDLLFVRKCFVALLRE